MLNLPVIGCLVATLLSPPLFASDFEVSPNVASRIFSEANEYFQPWADGRVGILFDRSYAEADKAFVIDVGNQAYGSNVLSFHKLSFPPKKGAFVFADSGDGISARCSASVSAGDNGSKRRLSLPKPCRNRHSITHELGHLIGLEHTIPQALRQGCLTYLDTDLISWGQFHNWHIRNISSHVPSPSCQELLNSPMAYSPFIRVNGERVKRYQVAHGLAEPLPASQRVYSSADKRAVTAFYTAWRDLGEGMFEAIEQRPARKLWSIDSDRLTFSIKGKNAAWASSQGKVHGPVIAGAMPLAKAGGWRAADDLWHFEIDTEAARAVAGDGCIIQFTGMTDSGRLTLLFRNVKGNLKIRELKL